jgi:hypothetical protein
MPTIIIGQNSGDDYTGVTDTQIKESAATTNYASGQYMEATSYSAGDNTRALIFVAAPSLGGPVTVSAATLSVRQETAETGARTIDLFGLLRGVAAATWNTYDGTNNWGTAGATGGADYTATALDSESVSAAAGFKDWSSAALIAYVQAQINAGEPMRFMLARNPITSPPNDFTFNNFSQSGDTDGNRPFLTITYELAPTAQPVGRTIYRMP